MKRILWLAAIAAGSLAVGGANAAPSVERGDYLVNSIAACGSCHTPLGPEGYVATQELGGRLVEETPAFTAIAPNITPAGRVKDWTDAELAKAIREGVRPDGSVIGMPMPFEVYKGLSDTDLASIVMYLRTVPAVENDPGTSAYNVPLPPAWGPPITSVADVPEGVTAEYGAYLAGPVGHCTVCHTTFGPQGPMLDTALGAGGQEFHGPWGTSVAANITPTGLSGYSDAELATIITTGVRPNGSRLLPPMSIGHYAKMKPNDVQAVVLYLRSLPAK
ncbi:c-type cytochrome [Devosia sp. ZB163]|uniref:c-type cytochrome n=1 Tax=Devosia sp. ZB163 TaxID=3025938 RepID=UPI002362AFEF|nr:c-type cytochrome [Devosia sp. ZB163]MDC9825876.1 c-type cytochrome [Devosia sp. ZB163]